MLKDAQRSLNDFLDNLWNIIDPERAMWLNEIILSIRTLFNSLFAAIKQQSEQCERLESTVARLTEDVSSMKISEGELRLGSMATQIIIKCGRFLGIGEPIHAAQFRTMSMLNRNEHIEVLVKFLRDHGFSWDSLQIAVQMMKNQRVNAAHPSNEQTNEVEIAQAIQEVYSNAASPQRIQAMNALAVLKLLSHELHETLFLSTQV